MPPPGVPRLQVALADLRNHVNPKNLRPLPLSVAIRSVTGVET